MYLSIDDGPIVSALSALHSDYYIHVANIRVESTAQSLDDEHPHPRGRTGHEAIPIG